MQNEKQRQFLEVHEKWKNFAIKFDEQTKGTLPRKMFPQTRKNSWKISKLKRKKSVRQKEKGLTNRFSYSLRTPKPMDKKIQKFLSHPSSGGNCKTSGEKKVEEKNSKSDEFWTKS